MCHGDAPSPTMIRVVHQVSVPGELSSKPDSNHKGKLFLWSFTYQWMALGYILNFYGTLFSKLFSQFDILTFQKLTRFFFRSSQLNVWVSLKVDFLMYLLHRLVASGLGWFCHQTEFARQATNGMVLPSLLAVVCSGEEMLESEPLEQLFIIYFLLFKRQAFPCTALLNIPQSILVVMKSCLSVCQEAVCEIVPVLLWLHDWHFSNMSVHLLSFLAVGSLVGWFTPSVERPGWESSKEISWLFFSTHLT